jgi:hypothetical protein
MSWSWLSSLSFLQYSTGRVLSAIDVFCRTSDHEIPQYRQTCEVEVAKKLIFEAKRKGIGSSVMEFEGHGKAVRGNEGKGRDGYARFGYFNPWMLLL